MMRIINKQTRVADAPIIFRLQYKYELGIGVGYDPNKRGLQYEALKSAKTPEDVDAIMGNTSWTDIICCHCRKSVNVAVEFELRYSNDKYAELCPDCINAAKALLDKQV